MGRFLLIALIMLFESLPIAIAFWAGVMWNHYMTVYK